MLTIGIIDDNSQEADDIQVSILENCPNPPSGSEVQFKIYTLTNEENFKENLFKQLLEDVTQKIIQSLIVDFKLDTTKNVIEGREIVDFMHNSTPEFPVVVLTNVVDSSKKSDEIDPDKVYPKKIFLNPDELQTHNMVWNIFRNIERYIKQRESLEVYLETALNKLDVDTANEKIIAEISQIESELNSYTPTHQTMVDKTFDLSDLKDVLTELKKIEDEYLK